MTRGWSIVSDLQRAGWENETPVSVPASLEVEVRDVSGSGGNLAVTKLRRDGESVRVEVLNGGASPVSGTVRLAVDNRPAATAPFSAPAGVRGRRGGAVSRARTRHPDGRDRRSGRLCLRQPRFLLLDATGRPEVLIVGDSVESVGFYATRVLQSGGADAGFDVQTRTAAAFGSMSPEDAVAAVGRDPAVHPQPRSPRPRDARELRAQGGGLLIAASPDVDASVVATTVGVAGFLRRSNSQPAARSSRRPTCAIRSSARSARWRRTWARCGSRGPGRSGPTAGRWPRA